VSTRDWTLGSEQKRQKRPHGRLQRALETGHWTASRRGRTVSTAGLQEALETGHWTVRRRGRTASTAGLQQALKTSL
jgi:hypothetical protein